jgi:hypothetical protein
VFCSWRFVICSDFISYFVASRITCMWQLIIEWMYCGVDAGYYRITARVLTGIVGDWKNHLTEEMETELNEKFLSPLKQMGLTFDETRRDA